MKNYMDNPRGLWWTEFWLDWKNVRSCHDVGFDGVVPRNSDLRFLILNAKKKLHFNKILNKDKYEKLKLCWAEHFESINSEIKR